MVELLQDGNRSPQILCKVEPFSIVRSLLLEQAIRACRLAMRTALGVPAAP
jgi:hypothetical protein